MKRKMIFWSFLSLIILLTGCAYPGDKAEGSNIPYADQLETIQKAIDQYKERNDGLLPIKTRDMETDLYIKYPIEFSKIVPAYTEKIPSNAYEVGGVYQYVLIDVETNPTVKLVDLRGAERIRELNIRKSINGYTPFRDAVGEGVYEIDFETMGFKEPLTVSSPYSGVQLPIIVGGDGIYYIDYSIDLNQILLEEKPDVKPGEDIRYLLFESYSVLPAYSKPYTVDENNEPIFMK